MNTVYQSVDVRLGTGRYAASDADLLFLPLFEQDDLSDAADLDAATGGAVSRARARGEIVGKPFDLFLAPTTGWKTDRVALIGAGPRQEWTTERVRRFATAAGLAARVRRVDRIALVPRHLPGTDLDRVAQALAEGVVLANYDGASYQKEERPQAWLRSVELVLGSSAPAVQAAIERGRVLGECTNVARSLSNAPGNELTPRVFAERAEAIGKASGLSVTILDEKEIARLEMGLLLGVARGSQEPPRLIVLKHEPKDAVDGVVLGLVGKGITFDTGGISIKPADNMDRMKDDMSGGAAVIAAMAALSQLRAPVRVVGIVPCTENMPGGKAVKPGDVIRGASGTTVEVINTDAEGRLVLGDGLWYAQQLGATHLVDVATLTGACVVALGKTTSGLFGTPDWWLQQVQQASDRAGDRSWPMPIFEDYREQLKSEIADMTNTGGRPGGAITAALFIKTFVGSLPWVHMDIAGTAWAEEGKPYQPKGATGVAVRTLAELALGVDAWRNLK